MPFRLRSTDRFEHGKRKRKAEAQEKLIVSKSTPCLRAPFSETRFDLIWTVDAAAITKPTAIAVVSSAGEYASAVTLVDILSMFGMRSHASASASTTETAGNAPDAISRMAVDVSFIGLRQYILQGTTWQHSDAVRTLETEHDRIYISTRRTKHTWNQKHSSRLVSTH